MDKPGSAKGSAKPTSAKPDKEKFADSLFGREFFPRDLFKEIISPNITKNVENNIGEALDNLKRVQIVERALPRTKLRNKFKPLNDIFKKDEGLAKILCKRGDDKSANADTDESMRYYNLALLAAPTKGKKIGEIYGRRAAMSLKFEDDKSCLKNIEMALKYDSQSKMKESMRELQTELVKTSSRKEDRSTGDYMDKLERKMYRNDVVYRVEGPPNPKIPVTAECIQVAYKKDKGRHLVTTADLAPDTTIIVENPYVNILRDSLRWDTQHCAACCKRSSFLIPCKCMFVMYCDKNCRVNGLKNGHVYECKCLPQLHALRTNWLSHAAFVTVCRAGPVELRENYMASKKKTPPISQKGFNPNTGIYEADSYYQISKLHTYLDKATLPALTVIAVILARLLDFNTDFFLAEPKGPERNGFITYVASRILLHSTSFGVNSFGLTEKVADKSYPPNFQLDLPNTVDGVSIKKVSSAIYPFISLLEHSCYPNTICEYLTNGRMAIITNRMIKAGEEVTASYGYCYWNHHIVDRRAKLNSSHHFLCKCVACRCHWPEVSRFNGYLCPHCSGHFHLEEMVKRCVVISFKDGNGVCRNCKRDINLNKIQNEIKDFGKKYAKALELVADKKPLLAIPLILDCIQFFQKSLCPPSMKLINSMILLGQAHEII